ncbi:MAG: hypothetical protein AAF654_04670 [Myxococcota bacterium]
MREFLLGIAFLIGLALVLPESALASVQSTEARVESTDGQTFVAQRKKRRRKRKKGKKTKKKKTKDEPAAEEKSAEPAKTEEKKEVPATPAPDAPAPPPLLDLSNVEAPSEAAKEELLQDPGAEIGDEEGAFDFGGEVDLGELGTESESGELSFEELELDTATMGGETAEKARFDLAMEMMSDEEFDRAAMEFRYFLEDEKFFQFKDESQYQLAKALYKLGFLDVSLGRFREILNTGPGHARFRKSIEWLFFISRKMADEIPVLAELAKFRNVKFPKAYRNEFNFLMAKYLFLQANQFALERQSAEQLATLKKGTQGFDFSELEAAVESSAGGGFDFGGGGFDFGGGGGAAGAGDGGFDFGGGGGSSDSGGGGFDFGGGSDSGGGGGFDFGGGGDAAPSADGVVRQELPTTEKEAIRLALDYLQNVEEQSRYFSEAMYLRGVLQYLDGADQAAVDSFLEVVRLLDPRVADQLDPALREAAFLQLARIHYEYKQFDRSAYYFDQIDRDSENWLTSLYEASWAYYQRGDFEKALGNLLTLHSPFFEREYFPESKLVKAIIYYEACRYTETREIVDEFLQRFTRVMKEIEKVATSSEDPQALYERISQLQALQDESTEDDVTARVVSLALSDPDIKVARDVVGQVQGQRELFDQMAEEFRQSQMGIELQDELAQLAVNRSKEAGETTRKTFERELYALKDLLGQAIRIKIEVTRSERDAIERRMRGESVDDEIVPAVAQTVVDDERLYWPYEGEYWRDELGNYELDFSMCRPLAQR